MTSGTVVLVELGYARVSTIKQDVDRQIEALLAAGVARERIYLDKKSGATVDRPGLRALLEYAREGGCDRGAHARSAWADGARHAEHDPRAV